MPLPKDVCDLCGLPLNHGAITSEFDRVPYAFCCYGCRQVFNILYEESATGDPAEFKKTDLFRQCRELGIIPSSTKDPTNFKRRNLEVPRPGGGTGRDENTTGDGDIKNPRLALHLSVVNMWCPACAWVIETMLSRQPGVAAAACHFATDRLKCDYDPVKTDPQRIIAAVNRLGYQATLPGETPLKKERKAAFVRFSVSAFLALNVMMLSFALYSGFFTTLGDEQISKISWPIFVMASVVLIYGGADLLKRGWVGLKTGVFGMETLVMAGALSAYAYSTLNLFSGSIHLYYDTAVMLVTLMLLGKLLERRARDRIQENLGAFFSLMPTKVRRVSDRFPGGRYVPADQLNPGDRLVAEKGDIVPADGLVLQGTGSVDESSLTGESLPLKKKPGVNLCAGTRVIEGRFIIKAAAVGPDSTLGQMMRIIRQALDSKTPLEAGTDRLLKWLVPTIFALSVGTGLVCRAVGLSPEATLLRAITVMVIACPCALGIAIPLTRVAGISLAGKKGILVRDATVFERSEKVDTVVFDKTGTLTHGQWALLDIRACPPFSQNQLLALASALEAGSDHYIAAEIRHQAAGRGIVPAAVDKVEHHPNGIRAQTGIGEVRIGSRDFVGHFPPDGPDPEPGRNVDQDLKLDIEPSMVYISLNCSPGGIFVFGDRIRRGAPTVAAELKKRKFRLSVVSGDADTTTRSIAARIGIDDARGGKLPAEKALYVDRLKKRGQQVVMVGDGINDAPALASSDLAVAVHAGSMLTRETADITLMRGDPRQLLDYLGLAGRVNRKIRQNFWGAIAYNLIAIPVAMGGLLSPLVAVSAMLCSSLTVIANTLLLIKHES